MKPVYFKSLFNLFGAISLGNGVWMLLFAENWYNNLPAAIHDTGPLNTHFVHDIGLVYSLAGIALLWCAQNLYSAWFVYLGVLIFYVGHALIHVVEILLGLLPPNHWWIDFPLVFLPAMVLMGVTPYLLKMQPKKELQE